MNGAAMQRVPRGMTRRDFLALGTGASLFALAGCGGDSSQSGGELTFPTWQAEEPGFADWWKALIAEFRSKQGTNVALQQVQFNNFPDVMFTRFSSQDPPDISELLFKDFGTFADQGFLEPLDDRLEQEDITSELKGYQKEMVWDGSTLGVMILGYGPGLFYNTQLLEDAGASEAPKTPEELLEVGRAATKGDNFGLGLTTAEHPDVFYQASFFLLGEGQNWVEDGQYNLTAPGVIQAMDHYREAASLSPKGATSEQMREIYFTGKIAMMPDGPWVLALRDAAPDDIKRSVQVAPMPFQTVSGGPLNSLHIPAGLDEETKDLVWEFIKLAVSEKFQNRYVSLVNAPPARDMAIPQDALQKVPELDLFNEAAAQAVSVVPDSKNIRSNYGRFSQAVIESMLQLFTTDDSTVTVMKDLQGRLNDEVKP